MDKNTKRDLKIVGVLAVGVWLLTRSRDAHAATGAGGGATTPPIYTPVTPNAPATPAGSNTPMQPLMPDNIPTTAVTTALPPGPSSSPTYSPPPSTATNYSPPEYGPPTLNSPQGAANSLFNHIKSTQAKYGSVKKARANMNTKLVRAAQKNLQVAVDGKPGPRTFVKAALNHAHNLPLVPYWRRGATGTDVAEYKKAINQVAAIHERHHQDGSQLRAAIVNEAGQGRGA